MRKFLLENVEPGSTILTDALSSYPPAVSVDYVHAPVNISASGVKAHGALPGVHRVAALVKRWLIGTHHGAIEADHLQAYLDEFAFRFNRRNSRARGLLFYRLLEQAVATPPIRYDGLVAGSRPKRITPVPPTPRRAASGSLSEAIGERPWRTT